MKILNAQQIKKLDAFTIKSEKISSTQLMYRAGSKCYDWIKNNTNPTDSFVVVCGPGNNGGDGLVIAKFLVENSCDVECVLLDFTTQYAPDYLHYLKALRKTSCILHTVKNTSQLESINFKNKVVIDAVFGIGLSRPAEGIAAAVIEKINQNKTQKVIAIDLPSGLYCDDINSLEDCIIQADFTLTFHVPKLSFFFPEGGSYPGKIVVLDIGLDPAFASSFESDFHFITPEKVSVYFNKRLTFTHKGSYGHANIIAGSRGKMGAAVLAAKAASFSGVGLLTATIPSVGLQILQAQVPIAMCEDGNGENQLRGTLKLDKNHTYGLGPGMGQSSATKEFLFDFLKQINQPVVMDADALNLIAKNPEMLVEIPHESILTPHIKEFERLTGKAESSKERIRKLMAFCMEHKVYVVLKDARTIIGTPQGNCFFSLNGTPGMATGGSGDVLAGLLTGLLAQGYASEKAAQLGVVLHGIAGELAALKYTVEAMNAESIIKELKNAFMVLLKQEALRK